VGEMKLRGSGSTLGQTGASTIRGPCPLWLSSPRRNCNRLSPTRPPSTRVTRLRPPVYTQTHGPLIARGHGAFCAVDAAGQLDTSLTPGGCLARTRLGVARRTWDRKRVLPQSPRRDERHNCKNAVDIAKNRSLDRAPRPCRDQRSATLSREKLGSS
jgi:hypothetical protein